MDEWDDLGDDELHARLVNRNVDADLATLLVEGRGDPRVGATITEVLHG